MGLREIKAKARRDLHKGMRVPAFYYQTSASAPGLVHVRVHTKWIEQGDLKGTNLNYAEREEVAPKVLFDRAEVANPPRNGYVIISAEEGYRIGQTEPADGFSIKAEVARLTPAEISALGLTYPGAPSGFLLEFGEYGITGFDLRFFSSVIPMDTGLYEIAGQPMSVEIPKWLDAAVYTITGSPLEVLTGDVAPDLETGVYDFTWSDLTAYTSSFLMEAGVYAITGHGMDQYMSGVTLDAGVYTITGFDIDFRTTAFSMEAGAYAITGYDMVFEVPAGDADADAIIAAMTVAPTPERDVLIRDTVAALKDAGLWDKLDVLYVHAAHDEQAGLINWKSPTEYEITNQGGHAFAVDVGFSRESVSYLDTGWSPFVNGPWGYKTSDAHLGFWKGDTARGDVALQILPGAGQLSQLDARAGGFGGANLQLNSDTTPVPALGSANQIGLHVGTIRPSAVSEYYQQTTDGSPTLIGNGQPGFSLSRGVLRLAGNPGLAIQRVSHAGAGLTAAEVGDLFAIWSDYFSRLDAEASAIISAMDVEPSTSRKVLISDTVKALKADGVWDKLDALYFHAAHDEQAGRINWKNPAGPEITGAVTFTQDQGFARNGVSLDTGLTFADGTQYGLNSAHLGTWIFDDAQARNAVLAFTAGAPPVSVLSAWDSGDPAINGQSLPTTDVTTTNGYWLVYSASGTVALRYAGNVMGSAAAAPVAIPTDNVQLMLNATHVAKQSITHWGGGVDGTDELNLRTIFTDYMNGL